MSQPDSSVRFRFGDYQFDPLTGELSSVEPSAERKGPPVRLSPQPAMLLQLLLEKDGELVSKEEIRSVLWPDTHVDFESSLHFCVRQVRAALGDDADAGRYVETLPRRGYRLTVPVSHEKPSSVEGASATTAPPPSGGHLQLLLWAISAPIALALVVALSFFLWRTPKEDEASALADASAESLRLAVLPFAVGIENPRLEPRAARLSEGLMVALTRELGPRVQVLGPLSTAPYRELPFPRLDALEEELDVDLVLNARIVEGGADTEPSVEGILVELIQTDNGAHLWADFYPASEDWLAIEPTIVEGISPAIETLMRDEMAAGRE